MKKYIKGRYVDMTADEIEKHKKATERAAHEHKKQKDIFEDCPYYEECAARTDENRHSDR